MPDPRDKLNSILQRLRFTPAKYTITEHRTYHASLIIDDGLRCMLESSMAGKQVLARITKGTQSVDKMKAKKTIAEELCGVLELLTETKLGVQKSKSNKATPVVKEKTTPKTKNKSVQGAKQSHATVSIASKSRRRADSTTESKEDASSDDSTDSRSVNLPETLSKMSGKSAARKAMSRYASPEHVAANQPSYSNTIVKIKPGAVDNAAGMPPISSKKRKSSIQLEADAARKRSRRG